MLHTFEEWNNKDLDIKRSKAIGRNKQGKALFSSDQVCIPVSREYEATGICGIGTDEYFMEEMYGRND